MTNSVYARVRFTIEVPAGSAWGADCNMEQIMKQAGGETLEKVRAVLVERFGQRVRFIDEPKVTAVLAVEK